MAEREVTFDSGSNINIDGVKYTPKELQASYDRKVADALAKQQSDLKKTTSSSLETNSEGMVQSVFDLEKTIGGYTNAIKGSIDGIIPALKTLDEEGTKVMAAFGTTRSRIGEFKAVIGEAIPSFTEMGLDTDPAAVINDIGNALGGAASIGVEAVKELAATNKVTGESIKDLAENFRDVGVSIYDVGDSMKEVVDYTRSVGGNVKDVSGKVVSNLEKLNMFNFSSGVGGLTKMAAQASRLGIDMDTVFRKSEELLDPEKAIDMAASLQRMGVANSEMLDPLRLMDMGLNGPDELMKSMTDVSKEFVQLNEKGQFEIMPGAKRRMREVAEAMGMTAAEFSKMAIKSADFDRKLQEIKMPDFVGDQETKEMIATMSQMKDGKAVITVKDAETGRAVEKEVDQLTPEDIENLKLSEAESAKSMEEIAIDQLDTLKRINAAQTATGQRISMAGAVAAPTMRAYDLVAGIQREIPKAITQKGGVGDFEFLNEQMVNLTKPFEEMAMLFAKGDVEGGTKKMNEIIPTLANIETKFSESMQNIVNATVKGSNQVIEEVYGGRFKLSGKEKSTIPSGEGTKAEALPSQLDTMSGKNVQNVNTSEQKPMELSTKSEIKVDFKITTDEKTASVDSNIINQAIERYFSDYSNVKKLLGTDLNSGLRLNKS
jgi:hypothetical protein